MSRFDNTAREKRHRHHTFTNTHIHNICTATHSQIHPQTQMSTCPPHSHTHTGSHRITRYKRHWQKIQTRLGSLLTTPVNTAFAWRMQLMFLGESLPTHLYTCTQTTRGPSLVSIFTAEKMFYTLCKSLSSLHFLSLFNTVWLMKESVYCFSQPLLVSDSPHFCIWLQWFMRLKTFLQSVMN